LTSQSRASGSLWTVPFDVDRLEVQEAAPLPVLPSVAATGGVNTVFDVSDNGTLVYLSASTLSSPERQLVWVDRAGKEEVIPAPPKPYVYPRLSPDGTRIAVDVREQENDIWVWDLVRRGFTRVTTHSGLDRAPLWLNGEQIVHSAMMSGNPSLFLQRSDGTGRPEQLAIGGSTAQFPLSLSPDGKRVVFLSANAQGNDLMMLQLDRPASTKVADAASATTPGGYTSSLRDVQLLVDDAGAQANGVISPDGRWFAYQSSESGTFEIYVRPFADTKAGIRQTVSNDGGSQPRWSPDGRELFYVSLRNNAMMGVRISGGDTWSAGTPEKLFDASRYSLGPVYPYFNYDLAKDGRFLLTKPLGASASEPESSASLVVVQNWFEELKRLVPPN
jgi:serine/threonine-protein kinase